MRVHLLIFHGVSSAFAAVTNSDVASSTYAAGQYRGVVS